MNREEWSWYRIVVGRSMGCGVVVAAAVPMLRVVLDIIAPCCSCTAAQVFSQYNRMIDLCEFRLKTLGLQTVKLMGYMPMKERRSVLHAFKTRSDIDVILMSLKVRGGSGGRQ